jgi:NAD-dependent deacetylase
MRFTDQDRLFVLTGAGISAESGLATFRDSNGLWNNHRVEDVATPEAWDADPALVWRFYSQRRRDASAAQPNAAHRALADLEASMPNRFFLCTQNVDDLHERGGSQHVHHMHGTLFASRCVRCDQPFSDHHFYDDPNALPTCTQCSAAIRPHIVWFGEVPLDLDTLFAELDRATHVLVIGTSGNVYPAAGFVARRHRAKTIYIGPEPPLNAASFDEILLGPATQVLPTLL